MIDRVSFPLLAGLQLPVNASILSNPGALELVLLSIVLSIKEYDALKSLCNRENHFDTVLDMKDAPEISMMGSGCPTAEGIIYPLQSIEVRQRLRFYSETQVNLQL